jgi:hypothetical protein
MDSNFKQCKGDVRAVRFFGKIWLDTWPEGVDPFEKIASYIGPKEIRFMGYVKETCPSTERAYLQCWIHFYHNVRMSQVRKFFPGCHITPALEPFNQDKLYLSTQSTMIKHGTYIEGLKRSFNGVVDTTHKKAKTTCELSDAGDGSIIDDSSKRFEELLGEVRKQNEELRERLDKSEKLIEYDMQQQFDYRYRTIFEEKWEGEIHSATAVLKLIYKYEYPGVAYELKGIQPSAENIRSVVDTAIGHYKTIYEKKEGLSKMTFGKIIDLLTYMKDQFDTKKKEDGYPFRIA